MLIIGFIERTICWLFTVWTEVTPIIWVMGRRKKVEKSHTHTPVQSPAFLPCLCIRCRPGRTYWRPTSASDPNGRVTWRSGRWWTLWNLLFRLHWRRRFGRRALQTLTRLHRGRSCRRSSWIPPCWARRWDSPAGSPCTTPGSHSQWSLCFPAGPVSPRDGACCSAFPCWWCGFN